MTTTPAPQAPLTEARLKEIRTFAFSHGGKDPLPSDSWVQWYRDLFQHIDTLTARLADAGKMDDAEVSQLSIELVCRGPGTKSCGRCTFCKARDVLTRLASEAAALRRGLQKLVDAVEKMDDPPILVMAATIAARGVLTNGN